MKYLKVFVDFRMDMEPLADDERGRLFTAMLRYAEDGTEPEFTGNERFLWGTAKRYIDTQAESYRKQCDANLQNITKRYEALRTDTKAYESKQDKDKDKDKDKDYLSIGRGHRKTQYRNEDLERLEVDLTQKGAKL